MILGGYEQSRNPDVQLGLLITYLLDPGIPVELYIRTLHQLNLLSQS